MGGYAKWKIVVFVAAVVALTYGIVLTLSSYVTEPEGLKNLDTPIKVSEVFDQKQDFQLLGGEIINARNLYVNNQVSVELQATISKNATANISLIYATLIPDRYDTIDFEQARALYIEYSNNIVFLSPTYTNSTQFESESTTMTFDKSGPHAILLMGIKNNTITSVTISHNQFDVKEASEPIDQKAAIETIHNASRIEGLTWVGIGFTTMLFLLEINRND